ncbi:MAG: PD-(D/E)XK nuclease family protein [Rikenellaceae bacterium]
MSSFLAELAESLYNRYGEDIGGLKILFSSRRARLFFIDELAKIAKQPLWQPQFITMDELMGSIAEISVGEPIRLISELFTIYKKHHPNESFDKFYFWGEIMLGDFDMVDKYMVDAKQLFRNISDIKELESDISYLSEEQKRIVTFWSSIGSDQSLSDSKLHFLKIWQSLLPIYEEFRKRLIELGVAYPGLIYRVAVERFKETEVITTEQRYIVAGFNALSECEKILFRELKSRAQVEFFWDRDDYYTTDNREEAGLFIRENIRLFPSADPTISHSNLYNGKSVEVIACSSSALQCKYVAKIIERLAAENIPIDRRTAIVLTDEGLLMPLLYALPESVGGVNVTMGYPIRQTLAYSLIERLLELQQRSREGSFYHIDVVGILSHPYINGSLKIIERIERERLIRVPTTLFEGSELAPIFSRCCGSWVDLSHYLISTLEGLATIEHSTDNRDAIDFLPFLAQQITTLTNSVKECNIEPLSISIFISLLRRHLQKTRVPFEGEPLEGLQVMGILESRNLDFDSVIILSMNDDNFPSNRTLQPSYIPYNLRAAYSLPTPEHHDGVYAYYFYRLIQRSKRLYMLYCSRADERSTGEQSRYISQLEYESKLDIKRVNVGVDINLIDAKALEVAKEGRVANELSHFIIPNEALCNEQTLRYEGYKQLSPTHLSTYIACPLKFYFKYIAQIIKEREVEERVDAPTFGNILHTAMESLYRDYIGLTTIPKIGKERINQAIESAIVEVYGDISDGFSGSLTLVRTVVHRYITAILEYDRRNSEFIIDQVEGKVIFDIPRDNHTKISIRGFCDRIDRTEQGMRIVDYKTGRPHLEFPGVESLFEGKLRSSFGNIFQILLYCHMVTHNGQTNRANAALYYAQAMNNKEFSPEIVNKSGEENFMEEFAERLNNLLEEIFNMDVPFRQCNESDKSCDYCDYRTLCSR